MKRTLPVPPRPRERQFPTVGPKTSSRWRVRETFLRDLPRPQHFKHVLAIQRVKLELRAESLDTQFRDWERDIVRFGVRV